MDISIVRHCIYYDTFYGLFKFTHTYFIKFRAPCWLYYKSRWGHQFSVPKLKQLLPAIWRLVTAVAYVMGFGFAFKAIYSLKIYGEQRTMMSSQGSIKTPVAYLIAAVALMFSPTMYHDVLLTTFGTATNTPLNWGSTSTGLTLVG